MDRMTETELLTDIGQLEAIQEPWDALAVASRQPMCSPAWMLGWLRHLAPADTAPRVVAVRERGELIGVAPFFVQERRAGRVDYRLMNFGMPRVSPLAVEGREWTVAQAAAQELDRARPRPDVVALEHMGLSAQWLVALRDGWPGRARPIARQYSVMRSPVVSLRAASFQEWLTSKNSSFRREIRRRRQRLQELGGATRPTTLETLGADVAAFMRLHAGRWEGRGISGIATHAQEWSELLEEIARVHLRDARWRMWMVEVEGEPIAAQLCAAASGELVLLNGGWDERFARLGPAILAKLAAIEDGFAHGDRRVDMCAGEQDFKLRLADGNDPVTWSILMLPGRRLPLTYARSAPMLARQHAREAAKRALSDEQADRVRALRERLRRVMP